VNGVVVRELGTKVSADDSVFFDGKLVKHVNKYVYYALHKPIGYITSMKDQFGRPSITDLIGEIKQRVYPVGRLDYNSSGLLILTNDGETGNRIMHPRNEVYKYYRVKIMGQIDKKTMAKFKNGFPLDDGRTAPAKLELIKTDNRYTVVQAGIREGKNRQIRRMFATLGHEVAELKRVAIGEVHIGNLLPGQYRTLTKKEMEFIQQLK
jgi:23S rRNA pseudouridine2605 synthase